MKSLSLFNVPPLLIALATLAWPSGAATLYVSPQSTRPESPYSDWTKAATNIQDAIGAAVGGDTVLVTNGIYATGGKVMAGTLTNRVALDKALTVQSVNGPTVTTIQGVGATNGSAAVRCAWLTNGASLVGFTLQGGATLLSGDTATLLSGGGAWCYSTNASLMNCLILSNAARTFGSGVYQGSLINCAVIGNKSSQATMYNSTLRSCTVASNLDYGMWGGKATNCVLYYNTSGNYVAASFTYCCTTPLPPAGPGNTNAAPQLLSDGIHLASTSPCRAAGTNLMVGTDIDGQAWGNPPSIGCDEWRPEPVAISKPTIRLSSDPVGFSVSLAVAGQDPFYCWWTRDGSPIEDDGHYSSSHTTNLFASGVTLSDPGAYQVVVSNNFGVITSAVTQLVFHMADCASVAPASPYLTWATAATNIQDAIEAALPGEVVLVTNGIYAKGGKAMSGNLTNRVVLDKALLVASVNGPAATTIRGAPDASSTNGPGAVRCVWLTNNSVLSGFTLCGGATRTVTGSPDQSMIGGGVWGASTSATVDHCLVVSNFASYKAGGTYQAALNHCQVIGNHAVGSGAAGSGVAGAGTGGGAVSCNLKNCVITANFADQEHGGGADNCNLTNCALTGNSSYLNGGAANGGSLVNCTVSANISSGYSAGYGGAVYGAAVTNSILWGNFHRTGNSSTNYASCTLQYCCSAPLAPGTGNISIDPQLLVDGFHLAQLSPCRGAGTTNAIIGTDIDGQSWTNPPAIGCDEWQPVPLLISQPAAQPFAAIGQISVGDLAAAGEGPLVCFWTKDSQPIDTGAKYGSAHGSTLIVSSFDPADAGVYQAVVSNAFGMVTSQVARVVVHCVDAAATTSQPPYASWAAASADIQSAITVASAGDFVLVTNGLYATGGKSMVPDLTNRVAIDKALTVLSVNGPAVTTIQGAWDPVATNGPGAVRCAWLTNGAAINGFTLRGGATRADIWYPVGAGGGVYASSIGRALVLNCLICSNASWSGGGGSAYGRLMNCALVGNYSHGNGGGALGGRFSNSTLLGNVAGGVGGGNLDGGFTNCIISFNSSALTALNGLPDDVIGGFLVNCCVPSRNLGGGNISADPQLVDSFHLATTSPCRGAGKPGYSTGTDLDGDPWLAPPSMGCDEVVDAAFVGPLGVAIRPLLTSPVVNHASTLSGLVTGRAARLGWSFGDGPAVTNASFITSHTWTSPGDYTITFTAYNADYAAGVSTTHVVHVSLPAQPLLLAPVVTTNGLQFQFPSQVGVTYVTDRTTNLAPPIVWQPIHTNIGTGSAVQVTDPVSTDAARFYRIRAQ